MINYTEHNKLAMPDLNSPADIRVISEVINNIDDGLSKFYVATSSTKNLYNIITGINKTELKNGYSIKIGIPSNSDNNVTVSVDNIAIPVKKPNGNPVKNFKANGVYSLTYYNGSFILVSGADESDTTNVGIDGSKVLTGTTFVGSDGEVHNGTMPNNGRLETTLTTHGATYNIPSGYTSGGQVKTNITNCTAENIKYNVSVGGVTGSFTGDGTIDASKVVKDYVGYSKGSRIVGTATIESLGGYKYVSGTVNVPLFYSKRGPSDSYIWSNETITLKEALNNKYKNIICYSISYTGCEDYNAGQSSRKMRGISAYGIIFKDMRKGMMCPKASMSLTQYNEINFDTEMREIFDDFTIMRIGNECPIAKYWNNPADGATVTYGTMKYGIICNDA